MADCPRFGKWIRGCRFEPRYNLGSAQLPDSFGEIKAIGPVFERFRAKTYMGDVCIRCGKTVNEKADN